MRTLLLTLTTCLFIVSTATAKYSGGRGVPDDPYQIATAADLIALGETPADYGKHFILTTDIDLDPNLPGRRVFDKAVIAPGELDTWGHFQGTAFTGVFDGNGHTIAHLTIEGKGSLGLFGKSGWPSEVKNLGVVDVRIVGSGMYVGALAGFGATVTSCYGDGDVSGVNSVGGLVGGAGALTSCYSTAVVRGTSCVGGLVGFGGDMKLCYSTGLVSGGSTVGGLVGYDCGTVTQSYSTAVVRGTSSVGGLVGSNCEGTVAQCYSTGAVSGTGDDVGGLVGSNVDALVTDCYSTGTVTGNDGVGGLVGSNGGELSVSSLTHCYSTGMVTGAGGNVGGLVGYNNEQAVVTASFWDIRTSGQVTSAAGTGKSTAEMQTASAFSDWGFCEGAGVWTIDDGHDYPMLSWEHKPGQPIQSSLCDFLKGDGTQDDPYVIYTLADVNAIEWFPCEQNKHFRLAFLSGTGTHEDPYLISTAEQLCLLGMLRHELNKHFLLTADIDLDPSLPGRIVFDKAVLAPDTDPCDLGRYGEPIFNGVTFGGVFDGNGHVVSHLTIKGASYLGLFGRLGDGAQVKNLGVVDVSVVGSGWYVGGLTGSTAWSATVTQCYSTGAVSGDRWVGGLVGRNGGTVTRCHSAAAVSGQGVVGALVGHNDRTVSECYSTGGGELVGGGGATRSYSADGGLAGYIYSQNGVRIDLTTTEMMDPYMFGLNGFANDPNWVLDAGRDYPRLAWEGRPGDIIPEPIIDWLEGQGTPDSSYQIDTADQLILLSRASILWDKHFVLSADIDLDPNLPGRQLFTQAPIQVFAGVFDGKGYTISHLTIIGKGGSDLGLFGHLGYSAEVRNVGVVDVNIAGSGSYIGGLAAYCRCCVANCYSTGVVSGTGYAVGGLVGENYWLGTVTHSYSSVSVIHIGFLSTIKILSPDRNIRASQNPAAFRFSSAAAVCFAA